jgi:hypothetical protein
MTYIQEQAIELIQQLPDEKIQTFIALASDEIKLMDLRRHELISKKKQAFEKLEALHLDLPDNFDADAELAAAMEDKYGTLD